jgi:DNA-binding MarR family transcriptional regulator
MSGSRRSLLQAQILAKLAHEPSTSITALAESIESSRPSVSRSLHRLEDLGLVRHENRSWMLTEAGQDESASSSDKLADETEEVVVLAGRKFKALSRLKGKDRIGQSIYDVPFDYLGSSALGFFAIESAARASELSLANLGIGLAQAQTDQFKWTETLLAGTARMGGIVDSLVDLQQDLMHPAMLGVNSALASIGPDLSSIMSPVLSAQHQYSTILSMVPDMDWVVDYSEVARQSGLFTDALDHLINMQHAETMLLTEKASALAALSWVSSSLMSVTSSFEEVFRAEADVLRLAVGDLSVSLAMERLSLATLPVTDYAGSVRYLVEAETSRDTTYEPSASKHRERDDGRLDTLLSTLDDDFVDMRRGAWEALDSDNPDRLRHAAASQRDLLTQLLRRIAPESEEVDPNQPGSKMKARLRNALKGSESSADFVESVSSAIFTYYQNLNKYTHTNQKHEDSLRALLRAGEGLVEFILVNMDD